MFSTRPEGPIAQGIVILASSFLQRIILNVSFILETFYVYLAAFTCMMTKSVLGGYLMDDGNVVRALES